MDLSEINTDLYAPGAVIHKYRSAAGWSQRELANRMGTSRNTIINWETGKNSPDLLSVRRLCSLLSIPLKELFGSADFSALSGAEASLLETYRSLTSPGQRLADRLVADILTQEQEEQDNYLRSSFFILPLHSTPASAGPGCMFTDIPAEPFFIKKSSVSQSADAVIPVSGDSMEPLYHSGDKVLIRYACSARDGSDVICSTADGAVIKRLRNNRLYSLNSALPFGEKYEDDNVHILGVVLGIVTPELQPTKSEVFLLEELLAPQIKAFYKTQDNQL